MPETDEEKRRKRERDALLLLFAFLLSDAYHRLTSTIQSYIAGTLGSSWVLSDTLTEILTDAHSHAAYLGRRLAGVRNPFGSGDVRFGRSVMLGQTRYLAGLVNDLANEKYEADSGALANRITLYVKRLRGTSEEAWAVALPGATLIYWVLGENENHCPECRDLAAGSPYRADSITTTPGSGQTSCLSACRCHLRTTNGEVCFELPEELP